MASIKKNFAYNLLLVISSYIFPLITFPYITRVLGVENIGACNYVDSIVNYFVLFSSLGIGSIGVIEIAKVKDDEDKTSKVFSSLVTVHLVLTAMAVFILLISIYTIPKLASYKEFFFIGLCKLLLTPITINWFYQGISNFSFITIRSLIIKISYVFFIFLCVHTPEDKYIYYALTIYCVSANSVINWFYSRRFVTFKFMMIDIKSYIMPILGYGFYMILTSMYTSFNVAFLGSSSSDVEVGYFTTATKLYGILMGVFSAFTTVMVPKISELLYQEKWEQIRSYASKTFNLVFALSLPIIVYSVAYANPIVNVIAGSGYDGVILPFQIVMALLLIVALEQIIIQQFLMVTKDMKCMTLLSLSGAVVGIICNITLVPKFASVGSSMSWCFSEITVLVCALFFYLRKYKVGFPVKSFLIHILLSVPYIVISIVFPYQSNQFNFIYGLIGFMIWFLLVNFVIHKDDTLFSFFSQFKKRLT